MGYKTRRSKACDFTKAVKIEIHERDNGICIFCKQRRGDPNMHFISRAQGGLGIPQNGACGCPECHRKYDQSVHRAEMREVFRDYLMGHYPDWDESQLYYRKGGISYAQDQH